MLSNQLSRLKPLIGALILGLSLSACGSGSGQNVSINGVIGPTVTYLNGSFLMSVVIENVTVQGGVTVPIPHMPNSTIEVGPDLQSNGLLLSVDLSATDIASLSGGNVVLLPPQSLPDGRPLPGVASGSLPALAVEVPAWDNVVFYVGPTIFGVFVPVKLGMQGYEATFAFYDNSGNDIGNISLVGEDTSGKDSGFVLLIPIKGAVGQLIRNAQQD